MEFDKDWERLNNEFPECMAPFWESYELDPQFRRGPLIALLIANAFYGDESFAVLERFKSMNLPLDEYESAALEFVAKRPRGRLGGDLAVAEHLDQHAQFHAIGMGLDFLGLGRQVFRSLFVGLDLAVRCHEFNGFDVGHRRHPAVIGKGNVVVDTRLLLHRSSSSWAVCKANQRVTFVVVFVALAALLARLFRLILCL